MNYKRQFGIFEKKQKTLVMALELQLFGWIYVLSTQKVRHIMPRNVNAPSFVLPPVILTAKRIPSVNLIAAFKPSVLRLPYYHRVVASYAPVDKPFSFKAYP
jgi:hypothetical protein